MVEVLPSILFTDFAHLGRDVAAVERGGAKIIHVDVMDGHFVPNLSLGLPVLKSLRKTTTLTLDCHLMIENPDMFIPEFAEAGANWVSVHYEALTSVPHPRAYSRPAEWEPAVVINPATLVNFLIDILPMVHHVLVMSVNIRFGGQKFIPFALDKIRRLRELREEHGLDFRIDARRRFRPRNHRDLSSKQARSCWSRATPFLGNGDGVSAIRELT